MDGAKATEGKPAERRRILGAALGNCVHVAGVVNFLNLARQCGHETAFLGPAVPAADILAAASEWDADTIAVGYRLSPQTAKELLTEFAEALVEAGMTEKRLVFGGTPPTCRMAEELGIFCKTFDGTEPLSDVVSFLREQSGGAANAAAAARGSGPESLKDRLERLRPLPMIRHHFGLPSLAETIEGVRRIAEAKVLDIISIGPDQNAQEHFFHPEDMKESLAGAGGVPIRTKEHLETIREAAAAGNFPLLRCYSGTNDLIPWAGLLQKAIGNAWAAIPLFWYSELDGRSKRPLAEAVRQNQEAIRWHADRGIPVEVNESHHWSLRDSHDAIAVAMAYLAAYNAKHLGVSTYIAQFMLNTPPSTGFGMDIAKMLAKAELISSLEGDDFKVLRQVRAGLLSLSPNMDLAKGQLASSVLQGLFLKPDIVHVVSFSEADHAATADDVIESCHIARGVMKNCLGGLPDISVNGEIAERKEHLVREAQVLLGFIRGLGAGLDGGDPLLSPAVLEKAVRTGALDSPHFMGSGLTRGKLRTAVIGGRCVAVDSAGGTEIGEEERLSML